MLPRKHSVESVESTTSQKARWLQGTKSSIGLYDAQQNKEKVSSSSTLFYKIKSKFLWFLTVWKKKGLSVRGEACLIGCLFRKARNWSKKVFFNSVVKNFPSVSSFPARKRFLEQICPACCQVCCVGLLHFGWLKTNFQSSKFHKISNLKNEKFDQIMPNSPVNGVCLKIWISPFPNHAQYAFREYPAFDQNLGITC